MKAKIVCLGLGLFLSALAVRAAPEDARFFGGSYDGWGQTVSAYVSLTPPARGTMLTACAEKIKGACFFSIAIARFLTATYFVQKD